MDDPGSNYRRIPAVSFGGSFATAATAYATIAPTGVESVNILAAGTNLSQSTTIIFTGANTSPAVATAEVSAGTISGLQLTSQGSGYTRTPTLVFSDSSFSGTIELRPTTVSSVVMTAEDSTLTRSGRVLVMKKIAEPSSVRKPNMSFGATIAGHENMLAVGAPTTALSTDSVTTRNTSGAVLIYDVQGVEDRANKVLVDGWLDGSSVMGDIAGTFSLNVWFRVNQQQQIRNRGTIFAMTNQSIGTPDAHALVIENSGLARFAGITAGSVLKPNEWNNAVYVCDAGTISVYVNGTLIGTTTASGTISSASLLSIGASFETSDAEEASVNGFYGFMSDIVVWNVALNQTEVTELQTNPPSNVQTSAIKANWAAN
ncbi:hypothetical protein D3C71_1157030 [compost metagenome]